MSAVYIEQCKGLPCIKGPHHTIEGQSPIDRICGASLKRMPGVLWKAARPYEVIHSQSDDKATSHELQESKDGHHFCRQLDTVAVYHGQQSCQSRATTSLGKHVIKINIQVYCQAVEVKQP